MIYYFQYITLQGDEMKNLGFILKSAREDNNLTQMQVMKLTGINNKTLSGYETGLAEPDLDTLVVLFNLYGLSLDKTFNSPKDGEQDTETESTEERWNSVLRSLPPERRAEAVTIIQSLFELLR